MKIKDIQNYIEGNANHLFDKIGIFPEELKQKVADRQTICDGCSFLDREKSICSVCSCKYPHLTYALDKKCPKKYWKEI